MEEFRFDLLLNSPIHVINHNVFDAFSPNSSTRLFGSWNDCQVVQQHINLCL